MKCLLPAILLIPVLCAQTPAPAKPPMAPGSKGPVPPPIGASNEVVAKVGGKPLTAGEMKTLLAGLPPDMQKALMANPKQALQSFYVLRYLSGQAVKAKLELTSPTKEQLALQRSQVLAQAMLAVEQSKVTVSEDEARAKYDDDPSVYDTAKLSIILIAFDKAELPLPARSDGAKPKKLPAQSEALAKAEGIVKQARSGTSFAQLAKANSDDEASTPKGGDYGVVKRGDPLPQQIRDAVFGQKAGSVSDPVKYGPGYYIIRIDEAATEKFDEVHAQVAAKLKEEKFQHWMEALQKEYEVTIENEGFFPKTAPTPNVGVTTTVQQ